MALYGGPGPIKSGGVARRAGWRSVAWVIALSSCAAACASSGAKPRPFPVPTAPRAPESLKPPSAAAIVRTALRFRGIPYRDGGSDPHGFDCSGFTQYVFAQTGVSLPREVRDQFDVGTAVNRGAQLPGDLVFFRTTSPAASHVGIVISGDEFVHAPSSRGAVRIERMSLPYWSSRFVGIRRIAAN